MTAHTESRGLLVIIEHTQLADGVVTVSLRRVAEDRYRVSYCDPRSPGGWRWATYETAKEAHARFRAEIRRARQCAR